MNSRDLILNSVGKNQPPPVSLPALKLFEAANPDLLALFKQNLQKMGGKWLEINDSNLINEQINTLHPEAVVIASAVPEVTGSRTITPDLDPRSLADVDVGIVRAQFGVAENGAVWLDQDNLGVNALGFLSQHLVVILNPTELVSNMHVAYQRVNLHKCNYGVFMAGPSATGDVEAVIVHGAQGPRSLTVFLESWK